jgi:hypothetical protein
LEIVSAHFDEHEIILEPSAGSGVFLSLLPPEKRVGIDLEPAHPEVVKQDFFTYEPPIGKAVCVVGNPPFGKNSSLAVNFFNHASLFADTIAFIFPRTFRKRSVQNRLDLNFHLDTEILLEKNSFHTPDGQLYDVPCVFQVWKKKPEKRKPFLIEKEHEDFEFLSKSDMDQELEGVSLSIQGSSFSSREEVSYGNITEEELESLKKLRAKFPAFFSNHSVKNIKRKFSWKRKPTFAWRRAGSNSGKVYRDYEECPLEGFEFILAKNDKVIEIFERMWKTEWNPKIDPARKSSKWDTAGQASISRSELIGLYKLTKADLGDKEGE